MIKPNINNFKTYFFDLDGTLYLGSKIIEGADKLIDLLNSKHKNVYALTNNCVLSDIEYFEKLQKMNIYIAQDRVINSTKTVIDWIRKSKYVNASIYVHGTESMRNQMRLARLDIVEDLNDANFIVIGNNTKSTWNELTNISIAIQKGMEYISSNSDLRLPLGPNMYGIDTGTITELIKTVSRVEPLAILGKTYKGFLKPYIEGESILFGDRIYTDMECAKMAGINNCLVLSGESTIDDYNKNQSKIDYVLNSINDLVNN